MSDAIRSTFEAAVRRRLAGHTFGHLPHRFIVSYFGEIVIPADLIVDSADSFALWKSAHDTVQARIKVLGGGDNLAVGVWYDEDIDAFVWDVSTSFQRLAVSLAFGKANRQKLVYDSAIDDYERVPH